MTSDISLFLNIIVIINFYHRFSKYQTVNSNIFTAQVALEVMGLGAAECILIGDRLETDIRMGLEAGMKTALVMTGVTDTKTLEASPVRPDHVLQSIADLEGLIQ
jgi:ribonucleotide monophosphatase NagD (HAD superfamily)